MRKIRLIFFAQILDFPQNSLARLELKVFFRRSYEVFWQKIRKILKMKKLEKMKE